MRKKHYILGCTISMAMVLVGSVVLGFLTGWASYIVFSALLS